MAWLATLAGGLSILPVMWMMTKLALRFPRRTLVVFTREIFSGKKEGIAGKIISFPVVLFYVLLWFLFMASAARTFGNVMKSAVLRETPLEVLIATLLLATFFMILVEVEVIARFNEVVFPLILVPLFVIVFLSFQNIRVTNFFPIFAIDGSGFLEAMKASVFSYSGFSIMLIFMAFAQKDKNVSANLTGVAIPAFIYTMIVFSSIAVFGFEELRHLMWPTLELVKTTDFPGLILERVESLFLGVWVAAVFTTVGNLYYVICFSLAQLFQFRNQNAARKWLGLILLPLSYFAAMQPDHVKQLFIWMEYVNYLSLLAFAIPFVLYGIAIVAKKGEDPQNEKRNT